MKQIVIIAFLAFICFNSSFAKHKNYLLTCWQKQVKPLKNDFFYINYIESHNEFGHTFEPWQINHDSIKGQIWCNSTSFIKSDTLFKEEENYNSITQYDGKELLFLDYNNSKLSDVYKSNIEKMPLQAAIYSPTLLLSYFVAKNIEIDKDKKNYSPSFAPLYSKISGINVENSSRKIAVYTHIVNGITIKLFISKKEHVLKKIVTLENDDFYGDIKSVIYYDDYKKLKSTVYPTKIIIEKINGKLIDTVTILKCSIENSAKLLLNKPENYKTKNDEPIIPNVTIENYDKHIHFVNIKHTDDKAMIVEFSDFLLVAEAPLNSANGELIINEAKKIAPDKPIRYFVFGHFHPHFIGGIRAFIHNGANIICTNEDVAYVKYLAAAPHTIEPDNLQKQNRNTHFDVIGQNKTIYDENFEMTIFNIGSKSAHTKDYLIYYFPAEKLLFEDDLVWVNKDKEIEKAGTRQMGLYNAIKELHLDVKTIVQSWPVNNYNVKTVIPFSDIEKSMEKTDK